MTFEQVLGVIGAVANVVMAGAAVLAVKAWRKQIAGASHHELAKQLSGALRLVEIAREATLKDLKLHQGDDPDRQLAKIFASGSLASDVVQLDAALQELRALEGQVDVQWGHEMFSLVETIRHESWALYLYARVDLDPERRDSALAKIVLSSPRTVAPTFVGGAYERALKQLTQLAQEWLASHVGRSGAKDLSTDELAARRAQVDNEIARRAEPELLAIAREKAEGEKRTAELGGPEALARRVLEEQARQREERETED